MQLISVYLYPNKLDVFTHIDSTWVTERYRKVYQRNLKIYRGIDNKVDIHVKSGDQKSINVTGYDFVFNLISPETQELLFSKTCEARGSTQGKIQAILTQDDLIDIEPGNYYYSVIKETRSNIDSTEYAVIEKIPMYVDSQYGVIGNIEIYGDVYGEPRPSREIKEFHEDIPSDYTQPYIYYSGLIDARPENKNNSSTHSFQFYLTDYNGEIVIQGSLSDGGNPHQWVDLKTFEVVGSNLKFTNIVGKWHWFRIKHIPTKYSQIAEFTVAQNINLEYTVSIRNDGRGYSVGDSITISGARLGGETPTNNLVINVDAVDDSGAITSISWQGTSYNGVRTFVLSADNTPVGTVDKILYR